MESIKKEFLNCQLSDSRLEKRLVTIASQLYTNIGSSLPLACKNWASTKATYRFFDNSKISDQLILDGHFQKSAQRFHKSKNPVLILHDTCELGYNRKNKNFGKIGIGSHIKPNRYFSINIQGLLMHLSLIVTTKGLPLGVSAVKFWTRKKFKGTNELKRHINPTRIPINKKESIKWIDNIKNTHHLLTNPKNCIHVGDREADIYELFTQCSRANASFVVRLAVNRQISDYDCNLFERIKREKSVGRYRITVNNKNYQNKKVWVSVKFCSIELCPPIGKAKEYENLNLYYIEAKEQGKSTTNRKGKKTSISWKLLTNIPVNNFEQAYEKIKWYAMRWKIETFFKVLKSGCKIESSKLRSVEKISKFVSINLIIAWKIFWLCTLNRCDPLGNIKEAFSSSEIDIVDKYMKVKHPKWQGKTISDFILAIAKMGGYLNRSSDSPPGNMVIWQGLSRMGDMLLGYRLRSATCG